MKYTADCPECLAEFEVAGPKSAALGVVCKTCGHKFTPNEIHRIHATEDSEESKPELKASPSIKREAEPHNEKWKDYLALKDQATNLSLFCTIFFLIGVLALAVGLTGEPGGTAFIIAGALISIAATFFIVAQLIHIRAALEKLSIKD